MVIERQLYTADDIWQMGDDAHLEVIRGEVREMSAAGGRHGGIGGRFGGHLFQYGQEVEPGEVFTSETGILVSTSPITLLVPDLIFIKRVNLPNGIVPVRYFEIPPDVVLEILSPSQRFADLIEKAALVLKFGVPLVWLVDPERRAITALTGDGLVRVYHPGEVLDGGDTLQGFSVPVDRLFP